MCRYHYSFNHTRKKSCLKYSRYLIVAVYTYLQFAVFIDIKEIDINDVLYACTNIMCLAKQLYVNALNDDVS